MPKLHNANSARVSDDPLVVELFDALLWLRNHYDVGSPKVKREVLASIDATLAKADKPRLFSADGFDWAALARLRKLPDDAY